MSKLLNHKNQRANSQQLTDDIMRLKLRHKVNGTIFITFVLIALVFSSIHIPFQQKRLQTVMGKIETLLQTLVERDRKPLANEIFEGRTRPIRMRVQEMLKVEGIQTISVLDASGKLLVSEGLHPDASNLSLTDQEASQGIQIQKETWHGHDYLHYLQEIKIIGERIGFVRMHYSLADVDREQHLSFVILGSMLGSVLLIMLVLLNLILSKTIVSPITFLRDGMQNIRTGELGRQVQIKNKDEIGDLSMTFNKMSADLADSYHKLTDSHQQIETQNKELKQAQDALRKLNEELEYRVEERTGELAQANAEIIILNNYLKDALVRSEKMAELGQLIAGVGHEIKTPLGAIRASVDNISHSLNKTLEQLPKLFQSLSEDLQNVFFVLLERSSKKETDMPSRQERKLKRKLTAVLEEQNISNADDIADTLVDMGIYDNIDPFLPLFRNKSQLILETAYYLTGLKRSAQNIATAVDRASKIVTALKSYAYYDHTEEMVESDLTEGIETVLILFHNQIKLGIEVIRHYEDLAPVLCYPDELNQVWSNLIHNAIQAMESAGTLEISVRRKDDRAVVTITDSGKGISDELKQRIFEPFFTTKSRGEGSGLGLDIVRKIIDKHRGEIELESEPGRTSFSVCLRVNPANISNEHSDT